MTSDTGENLLIANHCFLVPLCSELAAVLIGDVLKLTLSEWPDAITW